MRKLGYYVLAASCCLSTVLLACATSGDSGVEGLSANTGGSGANASRNTGGSSSATKSAIGGNVSANKSSAAAGGTRELFSGSIDVSGTDTSTEVECAQNQVPIEALPPDIMIVMDRSLSMTWDKSGGTCGATAASGIGDCGDNSRWNQTIAAMKAVVQDTQSTVNWGMFWLGNEATECGASTTPVVPITLGDSYTPIQTALDSITKAVFEAGKVGTPTAAVINNTVKYIKTLTDPNPKFLLLATDGEPNCANAGTTGGIGMPGGMPGGSVAGTTDEVGATNAIAAAAKAGFPTFVVGIATKASTTLDNMAVAGGNPQQGAETKYYAVTDTEGLKTVLNQIIGLATSCTISLDNTPRGKWTIAISAKDSSDQTIEIVSDPTDGWSYTDEETKAAIQLNGASCQNLKTGKVSNLQFVYTCPDHKIVL